MLGAGCPMSIRVSDGDESDKPLIPSIAGLTDAINRNLSDSDLRESHTTLLTGLEEDLGHPPNLEEMLTRLRTLATIAGNYSVRGLTTSIITELESALTRAITNTVAVSLPDSLTPYDDLAIWTRAASRTSPVRFFTTNYDLLLEAALERNSVPFFDGFVGVTEPFLDIEAIEMDELPSRWARLWKLHGSINWSLTPGGIVTRRESRHLTEQRLIHPSHLKYEESRRMPYLVMFDQLSEFLKLVSATLIIVGYSFADEHVNDLLVQGLHKNPSAKIFGLLYGRLERYRSVCSTAAKNPNLSLVATDGAVAAGRQAMWRSLEKEVRNTCDLGDFSKFGEYLRKLVGRSTESLDVDEIVERSTNAT